MKRLNPALQFLFLLCALVYPAYARAQQTYTIQAGDTPSGVARRFNISVDDLVRFNSLSPQGHPFRVGQKLDIPRQGAVPSGAYTVKAGDTIADIASFHGVAQTDLRRENNMKTTDVLQVGAVLKIPTVLRGGAKGHLVQQGDTLSGIARKHSVSQRDLMRANQLSQDSPLQIGRTLRIPDTEDAAAMRPRPPNTLVQSGEVVRGGVRHTVQPGQNLWIIARAYNVSGDRIRNANTLSRDAQLIVGQRILIPGARKVVPVRVRGFVIQPVRFVRVRNNQQATLRLVRQNGQVNPSARRALSILSSPTGTGKNLRLLHPRLIQLLQRVAERFPGNTIEVVSGYRPRQVGNESYHSQARAMDFRVRGVSNRDLYEFCTQLPNTGCGYYPNSVFIHMDVRDRDTTWTDYSKPGEESMYSRPETPGDESP